MIHYDDYNLQLIFVLKCRNLDELGRKTCIFEKKSIFLHTHSLCRSLEQ